MRNNRKISLDAKFSTKIALISRCASARTLNGVALALGAWLSCRDGLTYWLESAYSSSPCRYSSSSSSSSSLQSNAVFSGPEWVIGRATRYVTDYPVTPVTFYMQLRTATYATFQQHLRNVHTTRTPRTHRTFTQRTHNAHTTCTHLQCGPAPRPRAA